MTARLILVSGPPGAGKSTLCAALAVRLPAVHLDKDAIDEAFSPGVRDGHYNREIEPRVLTALLELARLNLRAGHTVLLDVPWTHIMIHTPAWIERVRAVAQAADAGLLVLECVLPEATLRERIAVRNLDRDQVKLSDTGWRDFCRLDYIGARNPLPHVAIDMTAARDRCVEAALSAVRGAM